MTGRILAPLSLGCGLYPHLQLGNERCKLENSMEGEGGFWQLIKYMTSITPTEKELTKRLNELEENYANTAEEALKQIVVEYARELRDFPQRSR